MEMTSGLKSGERERPDPNGPDHDEQTCLYHHLPPGQHEILGALAVHGEVRPTAEALNLSLSTVKCQLRSLRYKFGVSTNVGLIRAATDRGILHKDVSRHPLTGRTCLGPQPAD